MTLVQKEASPVPAAAIPPVQLVDRPRESTAAGVSIWSVWLLMSLAAVTFVYYFGVELPSGEDWANLPQAAGVLPITLEWLFRPSNEHLIPLARLCFAMVCHLADGDIRAGMYANAVMLSSAAALMIAASRKLRGSYALSDVLFPLMLLNFSMHVQYSRCIQIHFVTATLLVVMLIWAVFSSLRRWTLLCVAGPLVFLLPFDGGTTLVFAPFMACWLLTVWIMGVRERPQRDYLFSVVALTAAIAAIAATALVLYSLPKLNKTYGTIGQTLNGCFEVASLAWGRGAWSYRYYTGSVTLALLGSAPLLALWLYRRKQIDFMRLSGIVALSIGQMAVIGAISYGRSRSSIGAVNPDRYVPLIIPAVLIPVLTLTLVRNQAARVVCVLTTLLAVALLIPNTRRGVAEVSIDRDRRIGVLNDLREGMPLDAMFANRDELLRRGDHERFAMLAERQIGPYRDEAIRSAMPLTVGEIIVPIKELVGSRNPLDENGEWCSPGVDRLNLHFRKADVVGARIYYEPARKMRSATVRASWQPQTKTDARGADRSARFVLDSDDESHAITVLPFERIRRLQLDLPAESAGLRISQIGLLYHDRRRPFRQLPATVPSKHAQSASRD